MNAFYEHHKDNIRLGSELLKEVSSFDENPIF